MQEKQFLLGQIALKRKVMYHRAKHLGINHFSVIRCSQELDLLLNQYQDFQNLLSSSQTIFRPCSNVFRDNSSHSLYEKFINLYSLNLESHYNDWL